MPGTAQILLGRFRCLISLIHDKNDLFLIHVMFSPLWVNYMHGSVSIINMLSICGGHLSGTNKLSNTMINYN